MNLCFFMWWVHDGFALQLPNFVIKNSLLVQEKQVNIVKCKHYDMTWIEHDLSSIDWLGLITGYSRSFVLNSIHIKVFYFSYLFTFKFLLPEPFFFSNLWWRIFPIRQHSDINRNSDKHKIEHKFIWANHWSQQMSVRHYNIPTLWVHPEFPYKSHDERQQSAESQRSYWRSKAVWF